MLWWGARCWSTKWSVQNYNHKYTSGSALEPLQNSSTPVSFSVPPFLSLGLQQKKCKYFFADKDHKLPGSDDFLNKRKLLHFPGDPSEMLLQSMGKILSGKTGTNESFDNSCSLWNSRYNSLQFSSAGHLYCSKETLSKWKNYFLEAEWKVPLSRSLCSLRVGTSSSDDIFSKNEWSIFSVFFKETFLKHLSQKKVGNHCFTLISCFWIHFLFGCRSSNASP